MTDLTPEGRGIVEDAGHRHGMSPDAVRAVLQALVASGGGMAEFNHPDLGGMGQWPRGGMLMIGDMFSTGLKARVGALCAELSDVVGRTVVSQPACARKVSFRRKSSPRRRRSPSGGCNALAERRPLSTGCRP